MFHCGKKNDLCQHNHVTVSEMGQSRPDSVPIFFISSPLVMASELGKRSISQVSEGDVGVVIKPTSIFRRRTTPFGVQKKVQQGQNKNNCDSG